MMIFFLSHDDKVYARYGGRDARDAENRQSLAGLRATMKSVLAMHRSEAKLFAPRASAEPLFIRKLAPQRRGCVHCHHAKEIIYNDLRRKGQWDRDLLYRYPPPDNLGMVLDVDLSNVLKAVTPGSPADKAGLRPGDVLRRLGTAPVHSFGDAQFALDRAPKQGELEVAWLRDGKPQTAKLELPDGWKRSSLTWRLSVWRWAPTLHLYGTDLTPAEKKAAGLPEKQLAFRPKTPLHATLERAGLRDRDVIVGIDGKRLEMDFNEFYRYVQANYLAGDRLRLDVLREGQRVQVPLPLGRAPF